VSEARRPVHLNDTYNPDGDTGTATDAWRAALSILTDLDDSEAEQVRARCR
jgi:hypothetical protein